MNFFGPSSIRVMKLSEWLDMAAGKNNDFKVVLPMIQRGFVWKPRQIIELWDSLLQGMPIGTLMVSEMRTDLAKVDLPKSTSDETSTRQNMGLIDGQQRTLAVLAGWIPFQSANSSHRLWVDFGDEPPAGECVRLRITTKNQPFGYRRDDPNGKLTLDDKRRARQRFYACVDPKETDQKQQQQAIDQFENAMPYPAGAKLSLPIDLSKLLTLWRKYSSEDFKTKVEERLIEIGYFECKGDAAEKSPVKPWQSSTDADKAQVRERIARLAEGFAKLMAAEIPLLKVDPAFFELDKSEGAEPPLARLFKRIGSNATPLSDADYVYSILKHLMPDVHDMVEKLHKQRNVAALLTPTDLVMSTLRLAAISWNVTDLVKPNKDDFHRMIWPKKSKEIEDPKAETEKRKIDLKHLMGANGNQPGRAMTHYFELVDTYLQFNGIGDTGLPRHAFPYLGAPLVQVLLRLAHSGYLTAEVNAERRADVLRLVLYWLQWVNQVGYPDKASRTAFAVIKKEKEKGDISHDQFGMMIYCALVKEKLSLGIASPNELKKLKFHHSVEGAGKYILGESRFVTPDSHQASERSIRGFYRQWWRPWTHRHPMLLWLQRDYVNTLAGDPMAGMDDDTPYDFDHILPQSHWSGWTGALRGTRFPDFFPAKQEGQYDVVGNAIGNMRVWDAPGNRRDGDVSPSIKLKIPGVLSASAILESKYWDDCSPKDGEDKKIWSYPRALAFQNAVESRTFDLYQRLYDQAGFAAWHGACVMDDTDQVQSE